MIDFEFDRDLSQVAISIPARDWAHLRMRTLFAGLPGHKEVLNR